MAIAVVVALDCDKCPTRFTGPPAAQWNAGTIRDAAERAGWLVVGAPGSRTDRCPNCRPRARRSVPPPASA
ncbi:hypothetical protein [Micromonospora sp. WMMD737]|uniref:hypothetical protein n=1 Tax=Micromonospora sp. WMMD737 TaxID=3404113 RepID=UPI003B95FFB0